MSIFRFWMCLIIKTKVNWSLLVKEMIDFNIVIIILTCDIWFWIKRRSNIYRDIQYCKSNKIWLVKLWDINHVGLYIFSFFPHYAYSTFQVLYIYTCFFFLTGYFIRICFFSIFIRLVSLETRAISNFQIYYRVTTDTIHSVFFSCKIP